MLNLPPSRGQQTNDDSLPVTPNGTQDRAPLSSHDDQVRWFLVRSTVALMFLDLFAYLVTKDLAVLGTATIIGIAVIAVFRYYFSYKK